MEIWREGQRVKVEWGGMVDSEKDVSKSRKVTGARNDSLVNYRPWAGIAPWGPLWQELRGDSGTWRLGRHVSASQVRLTVFRRFDISSYQITQVSRVTNT
jgi:hypothetical protein